MTENFRDTYKEGSKFQSPNDFVRIVAYNDEIKNIPQLAEKRKEISPLFYKYMNTKIPSENKPKQRLIDNSEIEPYNWEKFRENDFKKNDFSSLDLLKKDNDYYTLSEL
jgi:hypothetical protein